MTTPGDDKQRSTALMRRIVVAMTLVTWIAVIAITAWRQRPVADPEVIPVAPATVAALEAAAEADSTSLAASKVRSHSRKTKPSRKPSSSSSKTISTPTPASPLDNPIPSSK